MQYLATSLLLAGLFGCVYPLTQEQKESKFAEMYKAEMTAQGLGNSSYVTTLMEATTASAHLTCAVLDSGDSLEEVVERNAKAYYPYLTEDMFSEAETHIIVSATTAIKTICPQHKDELQSVK